MIRTNEDKVVGNGSRNLTDFIHNKGWYVLNRARKENWKGGYTFVGATGSSVINYMLVSEKS